MADCGSTLVLNQEKADMYCMNVSWHGRSPHAPWNEVQSQAGIEGRDETEFPASRGKSASTVSTSNS